ncbi:MAG: hypothetical protein AB7P03_19910 [Kofleriaceae bacterium]
MATPAAIGVYSSGTGVPDHVSDRPWRGVYHHYDGQLSALGAYLVNLPSMRDGDVYRIVDELVDDAPWGWSSCFKRSPEKYPSSDRGFPVARMTSIRLRSSTYSTSMHDGSMHSTRPPIATAVASDR